MIKQLMCWLKTKHKNRIFLGFTDKQIDLNEYKVYKKYRCNHCDYHGKEFFKHIIKDRL